MLESDASARQRYTELVVETWLPPLRAMVQLFTTQVRCDAPPRMYAIRLDLHAAFPRRILAFFQTSVPEIPPVWRCCHSS